MSPQHPKYKSKHHFFCRCKPHVTGRQCDTCEYNHWGINSDQGCTKCDCDPMGAIDNDCDDVTGKTKQINYSTL